MREHLEHQGLCPVEIDRTRGWAIWRAFRGAYGIDGSTRFTWEQLSGPTWRNWTPQRVEGHAAVLGEGGQPAFVVRGVPDLLGSGRDAYVFTPTGVFAFDHGGLLSLRAPISDGRLRALVEQAIADAAPEPFLARWTRAFGSQPLLSHRLRMDFPDLWVRFHSLPESKRYPESEGEWRTVLRRWNRVLDDVLGDRVGWLVAPIASSDDWCWLATELGEGTPIPTGPLTTAEDCEPWDMRVWPYRHVEGEMDPWLKRLALSHAINTLFIDQDCRGVAAPYDGGIDVVVATELERDALRDQHSAWLSARPDGL